MLPGTPKEPFDCLYNTIPEIAEGIAIEVEETKEGELFKSEDLSNVESYSLPEYKTTLLKVDDCNQVIDQDAREEVEEFVLEDTVEYLENTGKEMCPAQDSTPETHNEDVSIEVIKSESKLPTSRSVRHSCPDCGKQFSSRTNVVRHQHSHRDSKPYQCDICKKEFTQSGTLKTHRYSHFDIKPFVCNVCGKRFTQSKSVKLHLRCHTGEKPYACDMCSAAFRQKNGLQRHMKVHAR
uniref:C2H2-type domain-containing protein n=2 Tax=Anopheles arabiensis TaxID=7173 RepID=A0A453YJW7_ANOAR